MSIQRYPHYRKSGIDWLGDIPSHWEVCALKRIVRMQSGESITSESIEQAGDYAVYGANGLRGYTSRYTHEGTFVLIGRQGALCGNVNYAHGKFFASEHAVVVSVLRTANPTWLGETLRAMNLNQYSIAAAQPGLSVDLVGRLRIAIPPLDEQEGIANFLTQEIRRIGCLVAEQERLIELLREKRQAVISQAATKGLNPDAPMKPSGIEWLGSVPVHWGIERGRFLFRQLEIPPEPDDGVVTAFRDGQVTLRENRRADGFTFAVLEVGYQRVRTGDLVIHGMDAFAGAIGVSESTGKCTPEYAVLEPARAGIDSRYYAMILRLMARRNFIYVICPSVRERAPRFRFESFKDVQLPVPPLAEQQEIMGRIEGVERESKALEAEADRAIKLLEERRAALISAAVTGQIDVRGYKQTKAA
jgi:type I restriction enzyme S subunit